MKSLLLVLTAATLAHAQAPSVTAEWDITNTIAALSSQAERLRPILSQLNPQDWVSRGAPEAYVSQWRNSQQELAYLVESSTALEKQPERLTVALDAYFRVQALESRLTSLVDGVRNYQNPALGDLLVGVLAENSNNRDRLRNYIADLAQQKEQEFDVVDKEAQRCRGVLNRQPAARPPAPAPVKKAPQK